MKLSLTKALDTGRIDEFAEEAEGRLRELGAVPVTEAEFDEAVRRVASKPPRSEDRTSRSASRDGLTGK